MSTKIEWTDEVWNPVTGCTKVSQGCKNCYAERIAERFWGERKFSDVQCHEDRLDIPLHWRKPRRVFVNSMSDLFHEKVSNQFLMEVFWKMQQTPQHIYQILTKRPERMNEFAQFWSNRFSLLPNVWLGVSVENQTTADERIPWLLKTPAAVRFLSCEPLLGPIDLNKGTGCLGRYLANSLGTWIENPEGGIDWVIAGGETGPNARPTYPDWFRSVRDQCQDVGVPFFLKQMTVNGRVVKMPELDGKVWNEYLEAK